MRVNVTQDLGLARKDVQEHSRDVNKREFSVLWREKEAFQQIPLLSFHKKVTPVCLFGRGTDQGLCAAMWSLLLRYTHHTGTS